MLTRLTIALLVVAVLDSSALAQTPSSSPGRTPEYTKEGQLQRPENYREWVFLSSGFDMSYSAESMGADHHMFDNVFVNPEAYKRFVETGIWPDRTMLVLELRGAKSKGSINVKGNYQNTEVMGIEVHLKDEARFPGKWAFYGFGEETTGQLIPQSADCYSCHAAHGAVDTTFVQFYPTLTPIAEVKGTIGDSYKRQPGK